MNKINENGRSMIEMLGVLAIIGVLSVGGIMGYSKAMFRYKINKTIDQITYIAGNIRTTFANQGNYAGLTSYCPNNNCIAKKARLFPDDMWKDGDERPQHAWDEDVYLNSTRKNSADTNYNKAFLIGYGSIPEESCIELITHDWSNAQVKMIDVLNDENPFFDGEDAYFIPPAKLDDAIKICNVPTDDRSNINEISFYFDIDTSDSYWKDKIDATTAALSGS